MQHGLKARSLLKTVYGRCDMQVQTVGATLGGPSASKQPDRGVFRCSACIFMVNGNGGNANLPIPAIGVSCSVLVTD